MTLLTFTPSSHSTNGPHRVLGFTTDKTGPVRGPAELTIEWTNTVGQTASFSASVGDPFGIISATVGIEFTQEQSYSISRTFEVLEGQVGYVGYTPYLTCVDGTLRGCDGAADESGQACTPELGTDGNPIGEYAFVSTSREGNATAIAAF
jgi:hypothetical protein